MARWRGSGGLIRGVVSENDSCASAERTGERGLAHVEHRLFGRHGGMARRPDLKLNGTPQFAQLLRQITSTIVRPSTVWCSISPTRT
jgi:hypothetical protein